MNFQGIKHILKHTPGYNVSYMIGTLVLSRSFLAEMTGKQQALVSEKI